MSNDRVQLLIVPGLGEDERMSYPQLLLRFKLIRARYIKPLLNESLADYSKRFAEEIAGDIDKFQPLFLMGVSLGGAVVQELSRHLDSKGVILISTYRSSWELHPLYRLFGKIAPLVPLWMYQCARVIAMSVIASLTLAPRHDQLLCAAMYARFPKPWFRQHARMAVTWNGCRVDVPILRIHGSLDPIIPYVSQPDIDVLIKEDKHMCNLSEKEIVNEEIEKFIRKILRPIQQFLRF